MPGVGGVSYVTQDVHQPHATLVEAVDEPDHGAPAGVDRLGQHGRALDEQADGLPHVLDQHGRHRGVTSPLRHQDAGGDPLDETVMRLLHRMRDPAIA